MITKNLNSQKTISKSLDYPEILTKIETDVDSKYNYHFIEKILLDTKQIFIFAETFGKLIDKFKNLKKEDPRNYEKRKIKNLVMKLLIIILKKLLNIIKKYI